MIIISLFLAWVGVCTGQQIPNQTWDYVTVRPEAHMFWWLYGSTAADRDSRPLVMWLQVTRDRLRSVTGGCFFPSLKFLTFCVLCLVLFSFVKMTDAEFLSQAIAAPFINMCTCPEKLAVAMPISPCRGGLEGLRLVLVILKRSARWM